MNSRMSHFTRLVFVVAVLTALVVAIKNPEEFVNTLAGTFTDGNIFSTGNTLPLIGYPWGFNHWSPQTAEGSRHSGSWWFHGSEHRFTFMRCTHQPSPWIGDWGYFLFSPQMGHLDRNIEHAWEPRAAFIKPYQFDATVAPWGIRIELAPTMHGADFRVTFPTETPGVEKRICFVEAEWGRSGRSNSGGFYITGRATQINSERFVVVNFGLRIRAESAEAESIDAHGEMICFKYSPSASVVRVRMATSLISDEQALVNLQREVPAMSTYDSTLAAAKLTWNQMLKRVDVVDPGELTGDVVRHLTIFYSGLYRALMFPRRIDEIDKNGNVVHFSPYSNQAKIFAGPLLTDNGFWDTFRTVYPLLALLYPDHLGVIIEGWLNAFREGGWLPSWSSPGYRNSMVGTYGDVIIADAIVKGIKGFDIRTAEQALMRDAFESPPQYAGGAVGKEGLKEYVDRGYFAMKEQNRAAETVSRTLDFGFADFAAANAFQYLAENVYKGDTTNCARLKNAAARLSTRSARAYRSMFDKNSGLMLPKKSDGSKPTRWNEVEWGNGYTEGNAWHHSFPPYALLGLIALHGGREALLAKLRHMLKMPSHFMPGSYGQVIHEMLEARALAMGQYGHNNQPVHHVLYLFGQLGDRETMEVSVRAVMDRAYGVDFFAGDEDNGEQGGWYVLSALGLYSTTPGTADYVLGVPLFRHVRIARPVLNALGQIEADKPVASFDIVALGVSGAAVAGSSAVVPRVAEVLVNNRAVNLGVGPSGIGGTIDYASLQSGVLRFVMAGERRPDGTIEPFDPMRAGITPEIDLRGSLAVEKKKSEKNEELISSLRAELSHSHDLNEELQLRLLSKGAAIAAIAAAAASSSSGAAVGAAAAAVAAPGGVGGIGVAPLPPANAKIPNSLLWMIIIWVPLILICGFIVWACFTVVTGSSAAVFNRSKAAIHIV